jgi:hypothetical protein
MFIRIRQTWFPFDAIDQIDLIGDRVRVSLCNGIKIDLDSLEGEKVLKQLQGRQDAAEGIPQVPVLLARIAALESRVMSLQASIAAVEDRQTKKRVTANA